MSTSEERSSREVRTVDVLFASGVALVVLATGWWHLAFGLAVAVAGMCATGLLCFRRLRGRQEGLFRALDDAQRRHYRQIEALFSVFSMIRPRAPMPPLRSWAISPDFAALLIDELGARRPRLVLELGSGTSTLLIGYALEGLGSGRVISLDHESAYASRTETLIARHGLNGVASVRFEPLATLEIGPEVFSWYGLDGLADLGGIDMLVVDGPPGTLGPQARYPALSVLKPLLAPDVVILVDDGARIDEAAVVKRWQALDPRLTAEYVDTEKGAYILRRVP